MLEAIDESGLNAPLAIATASEPVIKAAHALTANSGNALRDVPEGARRVVRLVEWLASQAMPAASDETEEDFADFQSWGSPAPRVDAADLAFDLVLIDPRLAERMLSLIDAALIDTHPAVRLSATRRLTALWFVDREAMWDRVSRVAENETNPGVLRFFVGDVLARLLPEADTLEPIVLKLAARTFHQSGGRAAVEDRIAELITALWLLREREDSHAWVERQLAADFLESKDFLVEAAEVAGRLLGAGYEAGEREPVRRRAQALMAAIVDRAADSLDGQLTTPVEDRDQLRIDASVELLVNIVRQMRTAVMGAGRHEDGVSLGTAAQAQLLDDLAPTLKRIGDVAPPRALHDLVEILDDLLEGSPEHSFALIAHGVLSAGRRFGYQYESLGADRIVKVVGRALADHRGIFENATRRGQLVEMLEMFVDQGWPQARRLLYELPELFR